MTPARIILTADAFALLCLALGLGATILGALALASAGVVAWAAVGLMEQGR